MPSAKTVDFLLLPISLSCNEVLVQDTYQMINDLLSLLNN